jgi:hypothetical protein
VHQNTASTCTSPDPGGIDLGYFEFMGCGTVVDSLSAIKLCMKKETHHSRGDRRRFQQLREPGRHAAHAHERTLPGNNDPCRTIARPSTARGRDHHPQVLKGLGTSTWLVPFTSMSPSARWWAPSTPARPDPAVRRLPGLPGLRQNGPTAVLISSFTTGTAIPRACGTAAEHQIHARSVSPARRFCLADLLHPLVRPGCGMSVQHHQQTDARCP